MQAELPRPGPFVALHGEKERGSAHPLLKGTRGTASLELGYALTERRAGVTHCRALAIKGAATTHHAVRPPRASADIDFLVEPDRHVEMVESLACVGWRPREQPESAPSLASHALTLIHPEWPCDIDLHREFPGFLVPPADAFEIIWARHETINVAGVDIAIPDRATSILIGALHAMRTPSQQARHMTELRYLYDTVLPALTGDEARDLVELAAQLGATDTVRPLLERTGLPLPPATPPGVDPVLDRWRERSSARGVVSVQHWQAVARAPWHTRPAALRRAIWPDESDFRLSYPETGPGTTALNRARVARVGRGLRALPLILRGRRAARRGITEDPLAYRGRDR